MKYKSLKHFINEVLAPIGYTVDRKSSFKYYNDLNSGSWFEWSLYIIEADTKLGFANINARRDKNFDKLMDVRDNEQFYIGKYLLGL